MTAARVTLLGKPGCHLCDEARATVQSVLADMDNTVFDEISILDDPALFDRYAEEIPIVLIDDRVHAVWRVDPERFRLALSAGVRNDRREPAP